MSGLFDPTRHAREELASFARFAAACVESLVEPAAQAARMAVEALESGGKLMFCGNGGSAAEAQHLAAEYVVRFRRERPALAAIALTTDSSILTAAANDDGYETVFARQVEALGRSGDLLFLHSTSGESPNVLRAAEVARASGIRTVALSAEGGGRLASIVDLALVVPTENTARAQEMHLVLGHVICDIVERLLDRGEDG
jgi:D-sedoheptulose 7-phosphate isomerase